MRCEKREKKWERMKKIWRVDFYIKWEYTYTNVIVTSVIVIGAPDKYAEHATKACFGSFEP